MAIISSFSRGGGGGKRGNHSKLSYCLAHGSRKGKKKNNFLLSREGEKKKKGGRRGGAGRKGGTKLACKKRRGAARSHTERKKEGKRQHASRRLALAKGKSGPRRSGSQRIQKSTNSRMGVTGGERKRKRKGPVLGERSKGRLNSTCAPPNAQGGKRLASRCSKERGEIRHRFDKELNRGPSPLNSDEGRGKRPDTILAKRKKGEKGKTSSPPAPLTAKGVSKPAFRGRT